MLERRARVLFAVFVVATALHIAYVLAHEPFAFDAWNVAQDTSGKPATVGRFFAYWQDQYQHGNPRLGQPFAYLAYKVSCFAEIATPLAFLALTLAITVVGLGRWPRTRRELALWAVVIGASWFVLPQLPRTLFSRAFATNYVYAAAGQLWLVAWVRLARHAEAAPIDLVMAAMAGLLAGMGNEHTGPMLVIGLAAFAWWQRRGGQPFRLPLAAALGAAIGIVVLLLAPGQRERYGGLAEQATLVERVLDRGVSGILALLGEYLRYTAPLLLVVVLVVAARGSRGDGEAGRAARRFALALGAGAVVVVTLAASPKLGSRFFIAPVALALAGCVAVLDTVVVRPRVLAALVAAAVAGSIVAAAITIPLYRRVSAQSDARLAVLAASRPGGAVMLEPYEQVEETWWFIGDDARSVSKLALIQRYFALESVKLRRPSHRGSGARR